MHRAGSTSEPLTASWWASSPRHRSRAWSGTTRRTSRRPGVTVPPTSCDQLMCDLAGHRGQGHHAVGGRGGERRGKRLDGHGLAGEHLPAHVRTRQVPPLVRRQAGVDLSRSEKRVADLGQDRGRSEDGLWRQPVRAFHQLRQAFIPLFQTRRRPTSTSRPRSSRASSRSSSPI